LVIQLVNSVVDFSRDLIVSFLSVSHIAFLSLLFAYCLFYFACRRSVLISSFNSMMLWSLLVSFCIFQLIFLSLSIPFSAVILISYPCYVDGCLSSFFFITMYKENMSLWYVVCLNTLRVFCNAYVRICWMSFRAFCNLKHLFCTSDSVLLVKLCKEQ